jgi:hypothetical protein
MRSTGSFSVNAPSMRCFVDLVASGNQGVLGPRTTVSSSMTTGLASIWMSCVMVWPASTRTPVTSVRL